MERDRPRAESADAADEPEAQERAFGFAEILRLLASLESECDEEIRRARFSSTPLGLYREMLAALDAREPQMQAAAVWLQRRLREAEAAESDDDEVFEEGQREEEEEEDEEEASAEDVGHGSELKAGEHPNPDGFVPSGARLPKGHRIATAHAEAVLLDRVRALMDVHYDEVFTAEWLAKRTADPVDATAGPAPAAADCKKKGPPTAPHRPKAYRLDARVLEAHCSQRYETFRLPSRIRELLRRPSDETDWNKLEAGQWTRTGPGYCSPDPAASIDPVAGWSTARLSGADRIRRGSALKLSC